ncbi:MAG TPA: 4Fe-4S binding protein [Acidobacteriota bacterium]|nr:4Fe-4S binding protein [Acidobacteriota bacterium]
MFKKRPPAALPPRPGADAWVIGEVEASCGSRIFEDGQPGEALSAAQGSAMSGRRSAAILRGSLESALPALRLAASRQVALVVHALGEADHSACHLAAESGCFLLMPEDAQQAADLTLLAHRVSEQSLVPAVLVHDWPDVPNEENDLPEEWEASLDLPSQRLVRRYLGQEDDSIDSPSEAQFQIFGEFRRRVPRWIDPDHPVAWSSRPAADTAAQVGREVFFRQQVADLARQAMDELARQTDRPLSPLRAYQIDKAAQVIVAQGAAFHQACRLASRLKRDQGRRVGVLGLTFLRPFSSYELRDALSHRPLLTVLERVPLLYDSEAPLRRQITAVLGSWDDAWVTAHLPGAFHGIELPLSALLAEQRDRPGRRSRVVLGLPAGPGESPFPKRESLLAAVRNAYPQLQRLSLQGDGQDEPRMAAGPGQSPEGKEPDIPPLVRRLGPGEHNFHSLAAFWGDLAQPLREGAYEGFPDPLFTLGSVPSSSAALAPAAEGDSLPVLDPDQCTGCGHCWTLCPDSAISATVLDLRTWLDHAIKPLAKHPQGSTLRRVMGKWVNHIASRLGEDQALTADLVLEAYQEVAPDAPDEDPSDLLDSLRTALEEATAPACILTERFFAEPESRKQGQGAVLFMAFNPSTCRACRACIEECPEEALTAAPRDDNTTGPAAQAWRTLESFPDTPGPIIAEALRAARQQDAPGAGGRLAPAAGQPDDLRAGGRHISAAGQQDEPRAGGRRIPAAILTNGQETDAPELSEAAQARLPYPAWTRLASILLSRHCAQAQLGGGDSEPGSGSRLAGRLIAAIAEYAGQQQASRRVRRVQELTGQVHDRLHKLLSAGLDAADPELLESALGELDESETRLARLDEALAKQGQSIRLDRDKMADLARLERQLQDAAWRLEEGPSRLGRARFQVVIAGASTAPWAARYPWHPFHAPLVADLSQQGIDLTLGLAESSARRAVEEARLLRSARLKSQDPPDLKDQLQQLNQLAWADLEDEERAACVPILLLTDPETLAAHSLASLSRLMTAPYPIKVILLRGGSISAAMGDMWSSLTRSMFFPEVFLLSSTPAHPAHLCEGFEAALQYPGPALIGLYSPSPRRDGFPPSDCLKQARQAAQTRLHPLFKRDPRSEGVPDGKQQEKEREEVEESRESLQTQHQDRRAQDRHSFQQQVADALRRRLRQLAGIDS